MVIQGARHITIHLTLRFVWICGQIPIPTQSISISIRCEGHGSSIHRPRLVAISCVILLYTASLHVLSTVEPPMSQYSPASETTCAASIVDASLRGAVMGAMWGVVRYRTSQPPKTTSHTRPQLSRMVIRSAIDVAAFLSIYSAVRCVTIRSSHSTNVAAGVAGAAAGCFAGARSGASGKMLIGTCVLCSAVSVAVTKFEGRNE